MDCRNRSERLCRTGARAWAVSLTLLSLAPVSAQDAAFRVGSAAAQPREVVQIPVTLKASELVSGFDLSIDFDETRLLALDVAPVFRADEGWTVLVDVLDSRDDEAGDSGIREGYVLVLALLTVPAPDPIEAEFVPVGIETEILELTMQVRSDAEDGDAEIAVRDGARMRDPGTGGDRTIHNVVYTPSGVDLEISASAGKITVRGPPLPPPPRPDPPRRYSVAGFSDVITTFAALEDAFLTEVAVAGDTDGDGKDDLLLRYQPRVRGAGSLDRVVLLHGGKLAPGEVAPLRSARRTVILTPSVDLPLQRLPVPEYFAGGQDIDGDGLSDFLVASGFEPALGGPAVLLVFGGALPAEMDYTSIGAEARGVVIVGRGLVNPLGAQLALSADMTGDGLGEVILADPSRDRVFVLAGRRGFPDAIDLEDIGVALPGFVVEFSSDPLFASRAIRGVLPLGDVDGDALAELGFVVRTNNVEAGYVLYGGEAADEIVVLSELSSAEAMVLDGYRSLSAAGDLDGDGFDDFVAHSIGSGEPGWAHVIFGRERSQFPAAIGFAEFASLELGFGIRESRFLAGVGSLLSTTPRLVFDAAGDIDGDGLADLLVSAPERHVRYSGVADVASGGAAFLVRGDRERDYPSTLRTDDIAKAHGLQIDGFAAQGELGSRVFAAALDGDTRKDLVLVSREVDCGGDTAWGYGGVSVSVVPGAALLDPEPSPSVTAVLPGLGSQAGGDRVLVVGRGFGATPIVEFGRREARFDTALGEGLLVVEAPPADSPIGAPVKVTTPAGVSGEGESYLYFRGGGESIAVGQGDPRTRSYLAEKYDTRARTGFGMASGDFNGDGHVDLAAAGLFPDDAVSEGDWSSAVHIVFGPGARGADVRFDALAPAEGVTFSLDDEPYDFFRALDNAIRSGGDVNGDGFDDIVVGSSLEVREWRLVFGRATFDPAGGLSGPDGTIRFFGDQDFWPYEGFGIIPDANGDGFDELVFTVRDTVFLVPGDAALPPEVDLWRLAESGLGTLIRLPLVPLTAFADAAGDVSGDGVSDLLLGGLGGFSAGAALVLYPRRLLSKALDLTLDATLIHDQDGFLVAGRSLLSGFDFGATGAGDVDGDGDVDLAFYQDDGVACTHFPRSGRVFVFDRETALESGISAERFPGVSQAYAELGGADFVPVASAGSVLEVENEYMYERIGAVMTGAGDFNGDGFDDFALVGRGEHAYVIFGRPDFYAEERLDLREPGGAAIPIGVRAYLVQGGFDWDEDGFDDIVFGSTEGSLHVVFGAGKEKALFIRGDADQTGGTDITDVVFTLAYLFLGTARPTCLDALDSDDDGELRITDAVHLLAHLFAGGPPPPAPYPEPGVDPTPGDPFDCRGG